MMKFLPNILTLFNLFCGCCALVSVFYGLPVVAAWFTAGCFLFDYADGMVARALKVSSPLGKELDSLADMVSFGVVPGAMLYNMMIYGNYADQDAARTMFYIPQSNEVFFALPVFILSAFSALRLGRFNIDTRQKSYFIGLSTPACTIFVLGLVLAAHADRFGLAEAIRSPYFIYPLVVLLSWLMNAEIPMFGMKIRTFDLKGNAMLAIFVAIFALLFYVLKEFAFTFIILIYIILSIISKNKIINEVCR
jgi:CDP-diacylglycerol---serine O-phosphatidyltransferase